MFGYISANVDSLSKEEQARYKACYCGLCRSLGERGGLKSRITLNYDMTFLVLLLSSLYEPKERQGCERCVPHPFKKHPYFSNPLTEYAADMNIALSYHKCMDDYRDEGALVQYAEARLLRGQCRRIEKDYPRQWQGILRCLAELSRIEAAGGGLDPACNCFGALMGELFVYREEDRFSPGLRRMGEGLGRFIYLMDAYEDLEKDRKKGRYNPLLPLAEEENYEAFVYEMMTMMLGECVMEFEKLPLVQDGAILRNILYSGLWTRYSMMQKKKKEGAHDPGSL